MLSYHSAFLFAAAALLRGAASLDNGMAKTPPMGWRSWNLYGANVNQKLIEGIMDGMVKKTREVDGKPTSLCDLGYCDVGLDDNWQDCKSGSGGNHYHDSDGNPIVNLDKFADMKAMTDHAHGLGLKAGWYGNNCICSDQKTSDKKFYQGDITALRTFGFHGVVGHLPVQNCTCEPGAPPKLFCLPHMAIEGVLTRQK